MLASLLQDSKIIAKVKYEIEQAVIVPALACRVSSLVGVFLSPRKAKLHCHAVQTRILLLESSEQ